MEEKVITKVITNRKTYRRTKKYVCHYCDYYTQLKGDYTKHCKTKKHMKKKSSQKSSHLEKKSSQKSSQKTNHNEPKTNHNEPKRTKNEPQENVEINDLKKQVKQLTNLVGILVEKGVSSTTNNNTNCNNTINNNNTINIQLFLNESCKDALPLEDFIKNVQFQVEDILYKSNNQLIKDGFATKLEKEILNTPVNERPIHVADNKRGIFHVKVKEDGEGSTWVKDETSSELLKSMQDARTKAYVASYDAITNDGTKADLQTCLMKQKLQKELTEDSISKNRKLIKKLAKNLPNIKEDIKELEK